MKEYKESQWGWLILAFVIPVQILITYLYVNKLGDRPLGFNSYLFVNAICFSVYFFFYGLTTTITSEWITVSFGIGLIKRRIKIISIAKVDVVKNPWYYGWGVRLISHGMLYNISGTDAVELKFHNSSRVFRIGSKNAQRLKQEIEKRMK